MESLVLAAVVLVMVPVAVAFVNRLLAWRRRGEGRFREFLVGFVGSVVTWVLGLFV